jgi:hypothetical protein
MAETLQEQLIREFFDPRYFGDPHDFAARAEIESLRARVKELEKPIEQKAVAPARAKRGEVREGD